MSTVRRISLLAQVAACVWSARAAGPADPVEFFKSDVRPILAKNCFGCHTTSKMGGLQLDAREHALQGGKSGPALVPGKPDESLLIRAVSYSQERLKMPPQGKLSDDEIATLRSWIQTGAHWDSAPPSPASNGKEYVITQEQRNFWSFRPVKKPGTPPETSNVQNRAWIR